MTEAKIKNLAKKIEENQYTPETYAKREDGSMDFTKLVKCPLSFEECLKVAEHFVKLIKIMPKRDAFENSIGVTVKPQTDIAFQPRVHISNF